MWEQPFVTLEVRCRRRTCRRRSEGFETTSDAGFGCAGSSYELAVQRRVSSELANILPNAFWDWLSDFDVRKKSPEVAAEQNAFIDELIRRLESGERLEEDETPR